MRVSVAYISRASVFPLSALSVEGEKSDRGRQGYTCVEYPPDGQG